MTHLPSTSVALSFFLSSPDKAWSGYDCVNHFSIIVQSTRLLEPPTEVHIQITFSLYSYIDYSHEFVGSALARSFNAPRTQMHKDRCVTLSQDNHAFEVRHSTLRWLHMLPKGRRASPEH